MCDRSITLHRLADAASPRVKETSAKKKERKEKRGGQGRGRRSEQYHRKKEGSSFHAAKVFTCRIEEALHVPAPSGRRGGPCVARKATRTMQLGLVVLAMIFLSSMGHSDALKLSKARRQRRVSPEMPLSCPKGCDRCSEYNGCIKCKPKLFIFLERNDIRQIGVCLASCPIGYFGMRNPEGNNRCTQCKIENCEACFNRNFCTKCKEGLYSHSGRCYVSCPQDQSAVNETMECVGQRTSDCELGEWSQWSSCMKKNKTCGFRKGSQSRSRVPLPQVHSPDTSLALVPSQTCASETERKKCTLSKKAPCGRERNGKGDRQGDTNRRERENGRGHGRNKGGGRGGGGGGGGGGRRRKGQSRTTSAPSITTSSVS